jgi:oligopeptide/dipeptide ABC transporter ATP-binding protein
MIESMLEVKDLKVQFFTERGVVKAVDGISFSVGEKETFGLVGESGCGKTITSLAIMKRIPYPGKITAGQILFMGENLLEKTEEEMTKIRGRDIAYIMQDPLTALDPVFRVGMQVDETIATHFDFDLKKARERTINILKRVGIPSAKERAQDYQHQFSGGMRQRIVIAISVSCNPKLLIADEPTTNLDATIQAQIIELIKQMNREFGTALILITHHLGLVAETVDRVGVMYAGDLVELADTRSIFYNMRHPYTFGLLKCIPRKQYRGTKLPTIAGTLPDPINPPKGCKFYPRCPFAMNKCIHKKPRLEKVGAGHQVACHLYFTD